jgi:hypothetical protein
VNSDHFVHFPLPTRRDWLCSSTRLRFYYLACLGSSAGLFLFVVFPTSPFAPVQLSLTYRLSPRSLRNHYLTLPLFSVRTNFSANRRALTFKEDAICCCLNSCVSLTLLRNLRIFSAYCSFWRSSVRSDSARVEKSESVTILFVKNRR